MIKLLSEYPEKEYDKGFATYYQTHIIPLQDTLEPPRERLVASIPERYFGAMFLGLCFYIILFIILWFISKYFPALEKYVVSGGHRRGGIVSLLMPLPFLLGYWLITKPSSNYTAFVKDTLLPKVVAFYGDSYAYSRIPHTTRADLKYWGIFTTISPIINIALEDEVTGTFQGIHFTACEAIATKYSISSKRKEVSHRGYFLYIRYSIPIGETIFITIEPKKNKRKKVKNLVATGDAMFDEQFSIYSYDTTATRDYMNPSRRALFQNLITELVVSPIECHITPQGIAMYLSAEKNLFEPEEYTSTSTDMSTVRRLLKEIDIIHRIIEKLKSASILISL